MIRERWFMRRIERQDARVVVIVDRTTGAGFTVHCRGSARARRRERRPGRGMI
jgi:hypothetical protein